ncbi:hydrogen gas-evolving membrane-bound hydrogenase subunit E [Marinobacterium jannaschii]|uniref:hydrogen gas-evolving membrane-bound hydrogenase subunit E n=1 Tax=Marinobacterium jannaschii TaxID=64970 RepID=UPI000A0045D5|nr:hydrogen gas-evolving membrane-bound hydrogenase subunit E [Marinobacterium jannaschii]
MMWLLFDGVLALLVLVMGWIVISSRDLRRAVVLFIAFGLLLSLIWARLAAPDLALAEAAIGAGLTGALLLSALAGQPDKQELSSASAPGLLLLSLLIGAAMAWALFAVPGTMPVSSDSNLIYSYLPESGVSNPVTAVLLNFRAYDTLLELAVLLCVAIGILALGRERPSQSQAGALMRLLMRALVPLLIVMSGYLLWVGAHAPGGAFQAGAVLAAAGVLLHLGGQQALCTPTPCYLRALLVAGPAGFLLVGLGSMLNGSAFLAYPPEWSASLILLIETGALLSIAATLLLAYRGGESALHRHSPEDRL